MSRTLPILTAVFLSLSFVAFAACGGDDEGAVTPARTSATSAASSPTTPSGAGATETATTATGAGATETAATTTAAGATETATTATGAGATETAGTPAEATATEAASTTPGPSFSGGATATVTVGGQTLTFEGGKCDVAPDETWLAVNIGQQGSESFGLLVGGNPSAPQGERPVSGGGVFTDGEIALTVEHGGTSFLLGGLGAAGQASTVTLAADLKSGEFQGNTLFDSQPISGSFHC
jgi:hypothetical protein